ncbi:MAG: endo-1,4-beta-xylanase [Solobacterium sp.]|nr:endo-1,4-beta-xylanase [Solobacterium sp.]
MYNRYPKAKVILDLEILLAKMIRRQYKDRLSSHAGFSLGVLMDYQMMQKRRYRYFVRDHFDSFTVRNDMKLEYLLDYTKSIAGGESRPAMKLKRLDRVCAWAQVNHMHIHGHVLVYHQNVPEEFFHEGYDAGKPVASREVLLERLKYYIQSMITHFEEKYPGVINCWDVVNEPIGEASDEYDANDPDHIRTHREGVPNLYLKYIGRDYVEKAFLYAREAADALHADIRLYLNEYNTFSVGKLPYILKLANRINTSVKDENGEYRKLCDGIGMQGYIGLPGRQEGCLNRNVIGRIRDAICTYADNGLETAITELTVRNYDPAKTEEHRQYTEELFRMFMEVNRTGRGDLRSVTVWGISDVPCTDEYNEYHWNSHGGLLDEQYRPKDVFRSIQKLLTGVH